MCTDLLRLFNAIDLLLYEAIVLARNIGENTYSLYSIFNFLFVEYSHLK